MGGFGSGNKWQNGKRTTSSCLKLDIRYLQKNNLLSDKTMFRLKWFSIQFSYFVDVVKASNAVLVINIFPEILLGLTYNQSIQTTWTKCHLGGYRFWFICPNSNCGKRVAVLYSKEKSFACRKCQNLAYQSQRLNLTDRLFAKADGIREKMGWVNGIANPIGVKPKGMHRAKYWRLCHQYFDTVDLITGKTVDNLRKFKI